jgi:hypothetical protein
MRANSYRQSAAAVCAAMVGLTGCGTESAPSTAAYSSVSVVSDAAHNGGTPGFYFLLPIAFPNRHGQVAVRGLTPVVTIEEVAGRGIIASFATDSGTGEARIRNIADMYSVIWNPKRSDVAPGFNYRIHVLLNGFELGFADAKVVRSAKDALENYRNQVVPLVGLPVPIAFRIEAPAVPPRAMVPQGSPITINPRAPDGSLEGALTNPVTGEITRFSIRASGASSADATYIVGGTSIAVHLYEKLATTSLGGQVYSGMGSLSQIQQDQLGGILGSHFSGLKSIPLGLGCGEGFSSAEVAALLVPWQLALKYAIRDRVGDVKVALKTTTCAYTIDGVNSGKAPPKGLVIANDGTIVPHVFGFLPFDSQGAVEQMTAALVLPITGQAAGGPCPDDRCPGACGANCSPNNCIFSNSQTNMCEKDGVGNNTGNSIDLLRATCGTADACKAHDKCYDLCSITYGCNTWANALCRHGVPAGLAGVSLFPGCDETECLFVDGPVKCALFAQGRGQQWYTGYETYEYKVPQPAPLLCPVTCQPNCDGKCGIDNDGCGGSCLASSCVAPQTCQPNGLCACLPNCAVGSSCVASPDGCGGICPTTTCTAPTTCQPDGSCRCVPQQCPANACSPVDDGCGSSCAVTACADPTTCQPGVPGGTCACPNGGSPTLQQVEFFNDIGACAAYFAANMPQFIVANSTCATKPSEVVVNGITYPGFNYQCDINYVDPTHTSSPDNVLCYEGRSWYVITTCP